MPHNTMSSHLAILTRAALVSPERHGRSIVYRANLATLQSMTLFLLQDCCGGEPALCASLIESIQPLLLSPKRKSSMETPKSDRVFNVLFLCTGNTARSIIAESILRKEGRGRFRAFSAGSEPKGKVNPYAIRVLERAEYPTDGLRSKNWSEFAAPDAPVMDFVFTVCDSAAAESCPVWPGQPMTRALGHRGSGGGRRHRSRKGSRLREGAALSEEPHRRLRQPAARLASTACRSAPELRDIGRLEGHDFRTRTEGELMPDFDLPRRLVAEALGTGLLVATVVGSGIMAETLTKDVALALLGNTLPTGAILVVLITILGPISGAHFNPAVTLVFTLKGEMPARDALLYVAAQIAGGIAGTMAAHLMFALPLIEFSLKTRSGGAQWFAEGVATFGLVATILGGIRFQRDAVPWLVGLYITAAYWFTASTSFANPAVAIARSLTNTFSGIRPVDLPGFIMAELAGAVVALLVMSWLLRTSRVVEPIPQEAKL